MSGAALFLWGLLKGSWRLVPSAFAWLLEKPIRGVLLLFAVHVALHQFAIDPNLRAERDTAIGERNASVFAHARTILSYRQAAVKAAEADAANKRHVESEQARITQEVTDDFQTKLAAARAKYDRVLAARLAERLRDGATRADPGGGAAAPVPGTGAACGRAAEAAGYDRLPLDNARDRPASGALTLDERLIATEQALQLDALIDWVERQAAVDVGDEVTK